MAKRAAASAEAGLTFGGGGKRGVLGDVGALAPPHLEDSGLAESLEDLGDRVRVDPQVARQFAHRRNRLAWRQRRGSDQLQDPLFDLASDRPRVRSVNRQRQMQHVY